MSLWWCLTFVHLIDFSSFNKAEKVYIFFNSIWLNICLNGVSINVCRDRHAISINKCLTGTLSDIKQYRENQRWIYKNQWIYTLKITVFSCLWQNKRAFSYFITVWSNILGELKIGCCTQNLSLSSVMVKICFQFTIVLMKISYY